MADPSSVAVANSGRCCKRPSKPWTTSTCGEYPMIANKSDMKQQAPTRFEFNSVPENQQMMVMATERAHGGVPTPETTDVFSLAKIAGPRISSGFTSILQPALLHPDTSTTDIYVCVCDQLYLKHWRSMICGMRVKQASFCYVTALPSSICATLGLGPAC